MRYESQVNGGEVLEDRKVYLLVKEDYTNEILHIGRAGLIFDYEDETWYTLGARERNGR